VAHPHHPLCGGWMASQFSSIDLSQWRVTSICIDS
jgi:hypothetical protein